MPAAVLGLSRCRSNRRRVSIRMTSRVCRRRLKTNMKLSIGPSLYLTDRIIRRHRRRRRTFCRRRPRSSVACRRPSRMRRAVCPRPRRYRCLLQSPPRGRAASLSPISARLLVAPCRRQMFSCQALSRVSLKARRRISSLAVQLAGLGLLGSRTLALCRPRLPLLRRSSQGMRCRKRSRHRLRALNRNI